MATAEPLTRWSEEPEDDAPLERRLLRLFSAVPAPASLSDLARRRVAARLRRGPSRDARPQLMLRLLALGVVLGMSGAATAQWASRRWLGPPHEVVASAVGPAPSVASAARRSPRSAPVATPQVVEAPALAPPTESSAPLAPVPSASVASSRLGLEAASLQVALSALRGGGQDNARRALAALDRHMEQFPRGTLELEARVARVDALLVLGRRQEARRELSSLPVDAVGRKHELRLIRAELRAEDDCRGALEDFRVLVEQPLPAAWAERALFGRGLCLLKLGDEAGAKRELARYLERFPAGRFAEQIRAQRR